MGSVYGLHYGDGRVIVNATRSSMMKTTKNSKSLSGFDVDDHVMSFDVDARSDRVKRIGSDDVIWIDVGVGI